MQFTLKMCAATQNRQQITKKNPIWRFRVIHCHRCWHS